jgi:hypothetical protein
MGLLKLRSMALLAAAGIAVAIPPYANAAASTAEPRASVVSSTPVLGLDAGQVKDFLQPLGVYVPEARYGVDAYRVVYRTSDVTGRATTASSLAVLPRTGDRGLRPAVWLHGTQSYRGDAPSVSECCDRAAAVLFAALGYAATAPDYLGLGEGPGFHPYFHAATMVSASVDALRATRQLAATMGRTVGGPVAGGADLAAADPGCLAELRLDRWAVSRARTRSAVAAASRARSPQPRESGARGKFFAPADEIRPVGRYTSPTSRFRAVAGPDRSRS